MRQTVVYLKKKTLEIYRVEDGVKTVKAETEWDSESLVDKLKLVKTKFETSSVRVLIERELSVSEMVLDTLAEAATEAKLKVEMVESESLEGESGEQIVALAGKDVPKKEELEPLGEGQVQMTTEVVAEEEKSVGLEPSLRPVGGVEEPSIQSVGKRVGGTRVKIVWIGLVVVLVIGIVVGGVMRSRSGPVTAEPDIVVAPSETVSPTPSPSSEPVKLGELSVLVLNGNGVAGEAGRVVAKLGAGGFDEAKIKAANAQTYDYQETEVKVKKELSSELFEQIKEMLGEEYTVVGKELSDSSEYEVEITVGTREGLVQGEATTAPSATPKSTAKASTSPSPSSSAEASGSGTTGE